MKQSTLLQSIILLLGVLLLTIGCNTDNNGIFLLVSQSEESIEIGQVTLIDSDGTLLFTHTSKGGLQSYNPTTSSWSSIVASVTPVLSSLVSTDGTNIYYSARSGEVDNNALYRFTKVAPNTSIEVGNSDYNILQMAHQHDLMLTLEGTDAKVRKVSDSTLLATYADHNTNIILLNQSDDYFLLSGYDLVSEVKEYSNTLYNGTTAITLSDVPTTVGIRAFFIDEANSALAVVTTDGDVYYDASFDITTDTTTTLIKAGSVTLATTTVPLSPLVVLHETGSSVFFIQGSNNYMYQINPSDGTAVETNFPDIAYTVQVSSFMEMGGTYYIGTVDNGVLDIVFP